MNQLSRTSKTAMPRKAQRGGVLILVALCLAVIVGIIGLAIDFNISLGGNTDQQQLANTLASGAIEAYLANATGTQAEKIESARARALEIAQSPKNRPIYQSFLSNPDEQVNLCLKTTPDSACANSDQGAIVPGYWHNKYTDTSVTDPCHGAANSPCFIPGDGAASDLTAFQVELAQSTASSIKTIFLNLLGVKSLRTKAVATAAVIPRHIVISVDLSGSIEGTTHLQAGHTAPSLQGRSAFKLAGLGWCDSTNHTLLPGRDPCSLAVGSTINPVTGLLQYCGGIVSGVAEGNDLIAAILYRDHPQPTTGDPRDSITKHYWNDYQCWDVIDDGSGTPSQYLIDSYKNIPGDPGYDSSLPTYQGPEPLTTILNSIGQALEAMKARKNAGDRVQLSFFDTTVLANRELPYLPASTTAPFALARLADDDLDYQEIKRIVDPTNMAARITQHAIFPRTDPIITPANRNSPWNPEMVGGVFTNIPYAVKRAALSLTRNTDVYARRNVVMISDFIPNCPVRDDSDDRPWCIGGDWSIADSAISATWARVDKYFVKSNKIAFSPILVGDYVRPHTTLPLSVTDENVNSGSGGCLWDENTIRMTVPGPLTYGNPSPWSLVNLNNPQCDDTDPAQTLGCGSFNANPPYSYYYKPNIFYGAARDTGGAWGVIRPCCRAYPTNNLSQPGECADVRAKLDAGCRQEDSTLTNTSLGDYYNRCPIVNRHCQVGFALNADWTDIDIDGDDTNGDDTNPYMDSEGRVVCDPYGRTEAQQMFDYMTKIMGSNSIVLVPTTQRFTQ